MWKLLSPDLIFIIHFKTLDLEFPCGSVVKDLELSRLWLWLKWWWSFYPLPGNFYIPQAGPKNAKKKKKIKGKTLDLIIHLTHILSKEEEWIIFLMMFLARILSKEDPLNSFPGKKSTQFIVLWSCVDHLGYQKNEKFKNILWLTIAMFYQGLTFLRRPKTSLRIIPLGQTRGNICLLP